MRYTRPAQLLSQLQQRRSCDLPRPRALRPKMPEHSRQAIASEAGSGTPPVPVTGERSRRISPPCPLRFGHCCCPKAGPHAGCCFTVCPAHEAISIPSAEFRVLLLRRLRLPLPLAPRVCACRGLLDPLGDHRATCANSGALASFALPLERAVARFQELPRVARNILADMNFSVPVADARRIEIVCMQRLATLARRPACCLAQPSCGSLHNRAPRAHTPPSARLCVQPSSPAGVASSLSQRSGPSPAHCSSSFSSPLLPASRLCMRFCKTSDGWMRPPAASSTDLGRARAT